MECGADPGAVDLEGRGALHYCAQIGAVLVHAHAHAHMYMHAYIHAHVCTEWSANYCLGGPQ